jgi:hypothetical protein
VTESAEPANGVVVLGRAVSDARGCFEILDLPPVPSVDVHAFRRDESPEVHLHGVSIGGGRDDLLVPFPARRAVALRLEWPPGVSGENRRVAVLHRESAGAPWRGSDGPTLRAAPGATVDVRVFAGRVGMEPADLMFRGEARVTVPEHSRPTEVRVAVRPVALPRLPFDWWDVEGDPSPGDPAAIRLVECRDAATGEPIASLEVLVASGSAARTRRLDADGRLVVPVALGRHLLRVAAPGYAEQALWLAPDECDVAPLPLRLRRLPRLGGS